MNCFEARKEFVAFWRHTLAPGKREAFNAHLRECARCEHAFRVFALSAPVLHSRSEPEGNGRLANLRVVRPPMPHAGSRTGARRFNRPWPLAAIGGAVAMIAAAALSIYVARVPPYQSLANTLIDDSAAAETVVPGALFGQETGPDFATSFAGEGVLGRDTQVEDLTIPGLTGSNPIADTNNLAG